MSSLANQLETKLGDLYRGLPNMPEKYRKVLVDAMPWLSLVVGIISLIAALSIWNWVHTADQIVNYANSLSAIYGTAPVVTNSWSAMLWLGLISLLVQALIYLGAFPGLRAHKKSGWNLLFYGSLLNVVYGIIVLFTSYGGFGQLIGSVIASAIGLYLLYQVRSYYTGVSAKVSIKKN